MSEQERQFQRNQYDARQAMQREIDDLRSRETALMRKYELESQGIKMLELRLKESLNMIESRERELASREHKMEEQSANNMDIAHRKAREFVQKELEAISIEKSSLMVERRKLDDEKAANAALIQSSKALRVQLQQALEDLIAKDDEILSIKRSHDTQEALRKAEDQQLLEVTLIFLDLQTYSNL